MPLFKTFRNDVLSVSLCRLYLFVSGLVALGLAITLLVFGSSKAGGNWFEAPDVTFLLDPFAGMTAIGALTLPVALMGCASGATANRLVAFFFMGLTCFALVLEVYSSVLCFLCARTSAVLARDLASYVTAWTGASVGKSASALAGGGSVLVAAAVLGVASLAAAARVAGCSWSRAKMPGMLTAVNTALASALLALAAAVDTQKSDDNSRFGIAAGCFTLVNAVIGWIALFGRWPKTARVHINLTLFAAAVGALVAAACIAAGNVRAIATAPGAPVAYVPPAPTGNQTATGAPPPPPPMPNDSNAATSRLDGDRLMLLGAFSVTAGVSALVEALLWIYAPARENLAKPAPRPTQEAVIQMYDRFVEEEKSSHRGNFTSEPTRASVTPNTRLSVDPASDSDEEKAK